ncbi:MAG: hypothetical protein BGO41_14300 [Clostridiales bacterium 38-18]|nr:MAG: hypothetical protein BGO41_14300 [Clostridiales bacterium 38-18]
MELPYDEGPRPEDDLDDDLIEDEDDEGNPLIRHNPHDIFDEDETDDEDDEDEEDDDYDYDEDEEDSEE